MAEAEATRLVMRSRPQRAKGHERVKKILDTAEALFAEVGFDAATTNEIAARANTSIGSLYQFFPNKEAILHALSERYRNDLREMYDRRFTVEVLKQPWPRLLDELIDALVEFAQSHRSFNSILLQPQWASTLSESNRLLRDDWVERLGVILDLHHPGLSENERDLYANVGLAASNALFSLATQALLAGRSKFSRQVVGQIKILLTAYFDTVTK